eukprot:comp22572_c0_seq1/m.34441 comp22572_c0_seq1/g.34441  ORF comp22572_c0_seq1/g.34441 comp22572_c0_seq1/m.34441 type:complete len:294 (-) comp22572_c0_seq1:188-1069(-)
MSPPFMQQLLATSLAATQRAGGIIRSIMLGGQLGLVQKGYDDPQTEADRQAQACIVASLKAAWPHLRVIAEEGELGPEYPPRAEPVPVPTTSDVYAHKCPGTMGDVTPERVVVWIDPLDGTKEFTEGITSAVTVLVGISVDGDPEAGVIFQPFEKEGRAIWGMRGMGVFGCDLNKTPSNEFIVSTTRSHPHPNLERAINKLQPTRVLRVGGAGNKFIQLLEGTSHVYLFNCPGTKKWDTCAGEALLRCVGGQVTDERGTSYKYGADVPYPNKEGVIATIDADIHRRCLDAING